ncbi:hypothetical protein FOC4_g10003261 [Fusarium odoratissimum]|uniref:Heterokaryon incompatibility domain-containing protein n=1 Tax=Fusarium oxysporum f. sp. cubense (strain race 4) TaxID=2502994 RepID=N1RVS8_FUSC4|nr:hypothetical protein FOC4_g10003261 [Fusarium odoratissimum]
MSDNAPKLCSACAAINFDKLFFPDTAPFNPGLRPPPDPCLGTLQEILDRSIECDVCKLIIEAHRQRYIRAPYGCSTYHPDFRSEVPGEEPEIHEEVKTHGLRLTVNKEPIKCFLESRNFSSDRILPDSEDGLDPETGGVGERFLWVDALCIVQDDPADLGHQTARMDLIYSKALFTILAACGEDSTSGLAGLPSNPRDVFQRQVKISASGLHVMPLVTLSEEDTLQFSSWNTRGWTFQERLLSRRSLIFTNKQVYWCCDGTTWEEESLLDIPGSTTFARSYSFGCYDEWDDNEAKFSLESFDTYITQFSERRFTYPSDVLPAFLGIIRRFEHLNNEKIHWGLNASTFDQALTWKYGQNRRDETYTYVSGGSTRSIPYPSWSWLGWTGFIGGSSSLRIGEDYSKRGVGDMKSLLAFYSLMSDGSVSLIKGTSMRRVNDYGKEEDVMPTATEKSSHDWVGDTKVTGLIKMDDVSLASELESLSVDQSHQPSPYDTGRIVFWTSHANISIQITNRDGIHMETSEGLVKLDLKLSSPFMKISYYRFEEALNEDSEPGESKVMNFLRRKPVATSHTISLIVISRYYGFYEGDDEVVKLNVMAVEEKVPGSGVWGRIGFGVMKEEEWAKLDINWRMVILE